MRQDPRKKSTSRDGVVSKVGCLRCSKIIVVKSCCVQHVTSENKYKYIHIMKVAVSSEMHE